MGIQVEFDPELALRDIKEFKSGKRKKDECIPEKLEVGKIYPFLKNDQRNFYMLNEIPLIETKGNGVISRPIASIILEEVTHFNENGKVYSKGKYCVKEIFEDAQVYYEGTDRFGTRFERRKWK